MKNISWVRVISMLLFAAMMLSSAVLLTGCGDDSTTATSGVKVTTISLRAIKEEGTTDEAIALVENAMNEITKKYYNLRVVLDLYTEDEYYTMLEEAMQRRQEIKEQQKAESASLKAEKDSAAQSSRAEAAQTSNKSHWVPNTTVDTTTAEPQMTTIDENGRVQVVYPDLEEAQLDIIYLGGYDKYAEYVDRELLTSLNEFLSGNSKNLSKFINKIFLDAAKINNTSYAVINSQPLGEAKYLVINKELAVKYGYVQEDFTTVADCEEFFAKVAAGDKDVIPFYAEDTSVPAYAYLFGEDVLVGGYIPPMTDASVAINPRSLFNETGKYAAHVIAMDNYRKRGYLSTEISDTQTYAAGLLVSNPLEIKALADEYYTILLESPMGTKESIYNGMYAISSYSENAELAMQVITLLNSNVEYRNLFQYGIEGVHYELVDGKVSRLRNDYMMDINKTGNVFLAHPEEYMEADEIEIGKAQNSIAVLDPYMNFTYSEEKYAADIEEVRALSKTLLEGLKNTSDVASYLEYARGVLSQSEAFSNIADSENPRSLLNEYMTWQKATY